MPAISRKKPRHAPGDSRWPSPVLTGEQLKLRLKTLLDKKRMMQSRSSTTSKLSASFIALEEGFQQFSNDLNKLQVRVHRCLFAVYGKLTWSSNLSKSTRQPFQRS